MNAEIKQPQALACPPDETCEICGRKVEFKRKAGSDSLAGLGAKLWFFHFERIDHPECIEKLMERRAAAVAEEERRDREHHEQKEREERKAEVAQWYGNASLPLDVQSKRFDTFDDSGENAKTVALLKKWRPSDDFGFLLYGPSGTGKSHLGFSLVRTALDAHLEKITPFQRGNETWIAFERNLLPHYESVASMLSGLRGTSGELSFRQTSSPLLFLDDLGAESITEWSREIFFRLFEHRLNKRLPVIITSNLSLNELKERMHERVVSRILGLCIPLQVKGDDRRKGMLADRVKLLAGRE